MAFRSHRKRSFLPQVKTLLGAIALGAASAGTLYAGHAFLNSPAVAVHHISIQGTSQSGPVRDVLQACGIGEGTCIFTADLQGACMELERDPQVARAVLRRRLPDTLLVELHCRRPVAVIALDERYLVDENGVIFMRAPPHQSGLPLLQGISTSDLFRDSDDSATSLKTAVSLIACLRHGGVPLHEDITISLDRRLGASVIDQRSNIRLNLGRQQFSEKLAISQKILSDLRARDKAPKVITIPSVATAYVSTHS